MIHRYRLFLATLLLFLSLGATAAGKTEVTWLGHSAFKITTPSGGVLLIDPWILGPHNPDAVKTYRSLKRVDYLLVTHGHTNAVGDAVEIARKTGAKLVAATRLKTSLIKNTKFPKKQTFDQVLDNWGSIDLLGGEVKVTLVPALHLSSDEHEKDATMRNNAAYAGSYGFIIAVRDGPTLYHTGDTKPMDAFEEIGKKMRVDAMLVCIGDRFTMGPAEAAEAVRSVAPRIAIPMHFGDSIEGMTGTPEMFSKALLTQSPNTKMHELKVGGSIAF